MTIDDLSHEEIGTKTKNIELLNIELEPFVGDELNNRNTMNTTTLAQPASTYRPLAETWHPTTTTTDYMTIEKLRINATSRLEKMLSAEDEFDRDVKTAISGDELVNRLSGRIYKMFENDGKLSAKC
ncbi:hypothetical protein FACS189467_3180 [Bacteroidia bacterium]|nr:hypothetical protein FACS189467_3180 [Bacteroidia bacterium]